MRTTAGGRAGGRARRSLGGRSRRRAYPIRIAESSDSYREASSYDVTSRYYGTIYLVNEGVTTLTSAPVDGRQVIRTLKLVRSGRGGTFEPAPTPMCHTFFSAPWKETRCLCRLPPTPLGWPIWTPRSIRGASRFSTPT